MSGNENIKLENTSNEAISLRISQLKDRYQLSAKGFADRLKVSSATVSDWEKGKSKPNADALVKMSELFAVPIDWILIGSSTTLEDAYNALPKRDQTYVTDLMGSMIENRLNKKPISEHEIKVFSEFKRKFRKKQFDCDISRDSSSIPLLSIRIFLERAIPEAFESNATPWDIIHLKKNQILSNMNEQTDFFLKQEEGALVYFLYEIRNYVTLDDVGRFVYVYFEQDEKYIKYRVNTILMSSGDLTGEKPILMHPEYLDGKASESDWVDPAPPYIICGEVHDRSKPLHFLFSIKAVQKTMYSKAELEPYMTKFE